MSKNDDHPLNPANIPNASQHDRDRWEFYQRKVQKNVGGHKPATPTTDQWNEEFQRSLKIKRRKWIAENGHRYRLTDLN